MMQFVSICIEFGGAAMPADKLSAHCLFDELPLQVHVKTDILQNKAL